MWRDSFLCNRQVMQGLIEVVGKMSQTSIQSKRQVIRPLPNPFATYGVLCRIESRGPTPSACLSLFRINNHLPVSAGANACRGRAPLACARFGGPACLSLQQRMQVASWCFTQVWQVHMPDTAVIGAWTHGSSSRLFSSLIHFFSRVRRWIYILPHAWFDLVFEGYDVIIPWTIMYPANGNLRW